MKNKPTHGEHLDATETPDEEGFTNARERVIKKIVELVSQPEITSKQLKRIIQVVEDESVCSELEKSDD